MRKRNNIRWRPDDDKRLKNTVRNFMDKKRWLIKKYEAAYKATGDIQYKQKIAALPENVTVTQLKDLISTRQDLNRELNSLQRFSRRGAEEIVTIPDNKYNLQTTKWQLQEANRRTGIINRTRKQRLERLESAAAKSGGEDLGYTVGDIGMGQADKIALRPFKATTYDMNRKDWNTRYRHIRKESQDSYFNWKDELLRNNYINSLERNYANDDIVDVIDAIQNMDFEEFYINFKSDPGTMEWSYPGNSKNDYYGYLEKVRGQWLKQ